MQHKNELLLMYYDEIYKLYKNVLKTKNIEDLKTMYYVFKKYMPYIYIDNNMNKLYKLCATTLRDAENIFNNKYLLDTSFYLDIKNEIKFSSNFSEKELLNYIVVQVRKSIIKAKVWKNVGGYFNRDNIWNLDLSNFCYIASRKVKELCQKLNVKCYILEIHPGYDKESRLFNGCGFHYFNVIILNNNTYLMDLTYSQFFKVSNTNIERIGIVNYPLTKPGYFMMLNDQRKKLSTKIINDGYIVLNEDTFKTYLDGFTISFRNGLYYENTKDYSYTTNYTINDYINFFTKCDNQINHEGLENLGYQKKLTSR